MYIVSRVDSAHLLPGHKNDKVYYAHEKNTPNIPIFGSSGRKTINNYEVF